MVSAAIWFTQNTAQSYNLGAVKVINSKTVQFTQTAGARNNQFVPGVLQAPNVIVPASVYGRLLPPDIWRIIDASLRPGRAAHGGGGTGSPPSARRSRRSRRRPMSRPDRT